MCVLLYPVSLGVCHPSIAARSCTRLVLPAIPAVVRSCHGRVCTIRVLLGMQQLVQLLPAFESRQKIDLLNSISLIFLRSSANNLKSWLRENSGTSLIVFLSSWLIANLWGKAEMGSACPCAAEGRLQPDVLRLGHTHSRLHRASSAFSSALGTLWFRDVHGATAAVPRRTEVVAVGTEATSSQIPGFRSDEAESCFAVGVGFWALPGYRFCPSGAFCPSGRENHCEGCQWPQQCPSHRGQQGPLWWLLVLPESGVDWSNSLTWRDGKEPHTDLLAGRQEGRPSRETWQCRSSL